MKSFGQYASDSDQFVTENLRKWFQDKWVRLDTKGNIKGPCAREEGEGKPKCLPSAKAHAMDKDDRAAAARRKRREDPNPHRSGKAINVQTEEKDACYHKVKARYKIWPSAYASGALSKCRKKGADNWGNKTSTNENFMDGRNPQDKGDMARHGLKGKSKAELRKVRSSPTASKRAKQLAHWFLNMHKEDLDLDESAWQRKEGKSPSGGLNRKGIMAYRRENPGSKLSMAVTTPPSKLDPKGKAAKRRKSFCARMSGVKGPMKDEKGRPTRKALALRKWNC